MTDCCDFTPTRWAAPPASVKAAGNLLRMGNLVAEALGTGRFEWQTLQIFMAIGMSGGSMPMQEIERATGWTQSVVSRNVAKLAGRNSTALPIGELVEAFEDPLWRRRKIVRLTPKGRELWERLVGALQAE